MAKKRKVSPKKSKKRPARSAPKRAAKRRSPASSAPSSANSHQQPPASFDEAKSAAIDALIRTIEDAEERLTAVKKASSLSELQRLV